MLVLTELRDTVTAEDPQGERQINVITGTLKRSRGRGRGKPSSYRGEGGGEKKKQRNMKKVWLAIARTVMRMIEMKVTLKYTDYYIQHVNGPLL